MAKRLFRVFNRIHVFLYRLTSGRFGGKVQGLQVLLLTVTGRRTGLELSRLTSQRPGSHGMVDRRQATVG